MVPPTYRQIGRDLVVEGIARHVHDFAVKLLRRCRSGHGVRLGYHGGREGPCSLSLCVCKRCERLLLRCSEAARQWSSALTEGGAGRTCERACGEGGHRWCIGFTCYTSSDYCAASWMSHWSQWLVIICLNLAKPRPTGRTDTDSGRGGAPIFGAGIFRLLHHPALNTHVPVYDRVVKEGHSLGESTRTQLGLLLPYADVICLDRTQPISRTAHMRCEPYHNLKLKQAPMSTCTCNITKPHSLGSIERWQTSGEAIRL